MINKIKNAIYTYTFTTSYLDYSQAIALSLVKSTLDILNRYSFLSLRRLPIIIQDEITKNIYDREKICINSIINSFIPIDNNNLESNNIEENKKRS